MDVDKDVDIDPARRTRKEKLRLHFSSFTFEATVKHPLRRQCSYLKSFDSPHT